MSAVVCLSVVGGPPNPPPLPRIAPSRTGSTSLRHSTHSLTPLAVFCCRRPLRAVQMVTMWTAPLTDQWTTISGVTAEKNIA